MYYLTGDERAAAEVFVEENRNALEGIDFSSRNLIQSAAPREVYDWILHYLGERELHKCETVVYEQRKSGIHWVIDRDHFEQFPNRRYSIGEQGARLDDISIRELYESLSDEIVESELEDHDAINGDVRYILEYYRIADEFACDPVTVDEEMAIRKRRR
ncbi:hypothetical protein [Halosolutus halophilus]|uniref:hypothetical protein n=1 Tax=Halosolutus halophilus TaxID=1552990 RepID=UPI00223521F5|nr:hypothetical protein [Halosolutus halophilus]